MPLALAIGMAQQRAGRPRGVASVEYVIIVVVVAAASVVSWSHFSAGLRCKLATVTGLFGGSSAPACNGASGPDPALASNAPPSADSCPGGSCMMTGSCFVAGTLVLTADGLAPIESIASGTLVLARDQAGDDLAWKPVARRFVRLAPALVRLVITDGSGAQESLTVTPEHLLFARARGWVAAGTLTPGSDRLIGADDQPLTVSAAESLPGEVPVYNLEIADYHTYYVGRLGAWAHNGCAWSKPRPDPEPRPSIIDDPHHAVPNNVDVNIASPNPSTSVPATAQPLPPLSHGGDPVQVYNFPQPAGGYGYTETQQPGFTDIVPTPPGQTPDFFGYDVPWRPNTVFMTNVPDNGPDTHVFFSTGCMNGCAFSAGGDPHHPTVGHMNYNGGQIPDDPFAPPFNGNMGAFNQAQANARNNAYQDLLNQLRQQYPELGNATIVTPTNYYPLSPGGSPMNQYGTAWGVRNPDGTWSFYYRGSGVLPQYQGTNVGRPTRFWPP
jgi:hypothetical protein